MVLALLAGCCAEQDKIPHSTAQIYVDPEASFTELAGVWLEFCLDNTCEGGRISQVGGLEDVIQDGDAPPAAVWIQNDGGDRATIVAFLGSGMVAEFTPHDGDIYTYDITDAAGHARFHTSFSVTYTYNGDDCNGFYTANVVVPTGT